MKKINKDYISVVRDTNEGLRFERIPMQKSAAALATLYKMYEEDNYTVEDMKTFLQDLPVFKFLAQPYYQTVGVMELDSSEDWAMQDMAEQLKSSKTKARFLEKAVALIEECDYRWNVIRITCSFPDILIHSHPGYDSTCLDLRLTKDVSIFFEANDLDEQIGGNLYFTVYKDETPVLPYRSVVELYQCSDDILDATRVFDPESAQWDNALSSFVATANAILEDSEAFLKANVIEAGHEMLEKVKLMNLDRGEYYRWIETKSNVPVDYSECDNTLHSLRDKEGMNQRLYELLVMGDKMVQAFKLVENLRIWSAEGLAYSGLVNIHGDLRSIAATLLKEMEEACNGVPEEVFSEGYGEYNCMQRQLHTIATDLRAICKKIGGFLMVHEAIAGILND